jgi:hypothetical protein
LLLTATLAATAWRLVPQPWANVGTALALAAVVYSANPSFVEAGWRKRNREMDAIVAEISKDKLPADATEKLYVPANLFEPLIWRSRPRDCGRSTARLSQ